MYIVINLTAIQLQYFGYINDEHKIWLTRRVPLVEQEMITIPKHPIESQKCEILDSSPNLKWCWQQCEIHSKNKTQNYDLILILISLQRLIGFPFSDKNYRFWENILLQDIFLYQLLYFQNIMSTTYIQMWLSQIL